MDFVKSNFIGLIAIVLFLFLWLSKCNGNNGNGSGTKDTLTVKTETVYVPQPPVYIPQYIPVATGSQAPIVIPPSYQPSGNYEALLKQYNELVNKHLTTNKYDEKFPLKDSSGNNVGEFNTHMQVQENELKTIGADYKLNFPHTTTTITIADNYRRFYAGGSLTGGYPTLVNGVSGDLLYKDKKDKFYGIGGGVITIPDRGLVPYGKISVYVPIGKKMK